MKVETSTRTAIALSLVLALLVLARARQQPAPSPVKPEVELPSIPPTASILENLRIEVELTRQRIDTIDVQLWELSETSHLCAGLREVFTRTWGIPTESTPDPGWSLPGTILSIGMREPSACLVRLRRTATASDWFETVLHVEAIGAPVAELESKIADLNPHPELHGVKWRDTGLGGEPVELWANVRGGLVVGVAVTMEGDPGDSTWHSVLARYGAYDSSIQDEGVSVWTWRRAHVVFRGIAQDAPWPQPRHPKHPMVGGMAIVEIGRVLSSS